MLFQRPDVLFNRSPCKTLCHIIVFTLYVFCNQSWFLWVTKLSSCLRYSNYNNVTCHAYLFIYLVCHIYPGVPHQCAALFSLGLLHYMHDKTNINQHTFSYNTVTTLTTWYIHHYMHNVNYLYVFLITVVTCRCRFMFGQHYVFD